MDHWVEPLPVGLAPRHDQRRHWCASRRHCTLHQAAWRGDDVLHCVCHQRVPGELRPSATTITKTTLTHHHWMLQPPFSSCLQALASLLRLAKFVRLIPRPAMIGFVNGLAIILAMGQIGQFQVRAASHINRRHCFWTHPSHHPPDQRINPPDCWTAGCVAVRCRDWMDVVCGGHYGGCISAVATYSQGREGAAAVAVGYLGRHTGRAPDCEASGLPHAAD